MLCAFNVWHARRVGRGGPTGREPMRLRTGRWILAAGLAAGIATGNAWAAPETDETVSIKTLSGAYLAARVAETDNDLASAINYYRRAISFDAENQTLQQSLML